ncbi:acetyl hydrolase [Mycobacterium sp. MS1601]|uniref:alpha/beta hydrolase n=1 Tax=Mycobacterium sp. MS1601 TaxID=1936029 RepID=UPI0009791F8F|nr:alpha/beta hydrolase [Mycobacterium sp. MS1601]AQA01608.1 acetyl hydrolase [Mycobacterium sp. MS1601]
MDPIPGRGSVRSRVAARVSALTLRQISAVLPPDKAWGLWVSRRIVASVMETFGPSLSGVTIDHIDDTLPDGRRVLGDWITTTASDTESVIYYLHGSGYAVCSAHTHRRLAGWLSRLTGLPVFCPDYRLAPQHPFPAAADDIHAGWDWLRTVRGANHIVVAGDSAGGHLAVDLVLHHGAAHPTALVLFSPLVDLTFARARTRERLRPDPAIRSADAARLVAMYWQGMDSTHPRLCHDLTGRADLPPLLIQAGGTEMLAADAHHLAQNWSGDCRLQVWPDQVHVFQALPRLTPEARPAMQEVASFIRDALAHNTVDSIAG